MKMEKKDPYTFRYLYKKLYSLVLTNNPARISVPYRMDNGRYVPGQLERFMEAAESQPDAGALITYIQQNIGICDGCRSRAEGRKKTEERCGRWADIGGARRFTAMCNPAISKYHRGKPHYDYAEDDIPMIKRMMDIRIIQVDGYGGSV